MYEYFLYLVTTNVRLLELLDIHHMQAASPSESVKTCNPHQASSSVSFLPRRPTNNQSYHRLRTPRVWNAFTCGLE